MLQVFFIAFFFCLLFNVSLISVCTNSSLKHNLSFGFLCFEKLSSSQYHSLSFLTSFKFHFVNLTVQSIVLYNIRQRTLHYRIFSLYQFSSVTQSCPTLCDPMDCSMPGFPVHHQFPVLAQTHVHRVGDAIQPSHPLSSPSPAFNLSQHQGLFR